MADLLPGTFSTLPLFRERPALWADVLADIDRRLLLKSEGMRVQLGEPQLASPALVEQSRAVVRGCDAFFRQLVAAYARDEARRPSHLINPLFAGAIDRGIDLPVTLLGRLDCVLDGKGVLRVIEYNSVGICFVHLRNSLYVEWIARRRGDHDLAAEMARVGAVTSAGFRRAAEQHLGPRSEPFSIGVLRGRNMHRGTMLILTEMFARNGWSAVCGAPSDVDVGRDGVTVRGRRVDVLWVDDLVYFGYQHARYEETKFPSRVGDFSTTPKDSLAILDHPTVVGLMSERRLALLSPMGAYTCLAKTLLAAAADPAVVPDAGERAWLDRHLARSFDGVARSNGKVARTSVARDRGDWVFKPALYGGSHGVGVGAAMADAEWQALVAQAWDDPTWVLQEYVEPTRVADGRFLSVGLYSLAGELGSIALRIAPSVLVGAREAPYIEALW